MKEKEQRYENVFVFYEQQAEMLQKLQALLWFNCFQIHNLS